MRSLNDIKITLTNSSFRRDELDTYLNSIRRYKPLTDEEEIELSRKAHNGNEKAKTDLINANLSFVVSVAKRYQGMGLDLLDLISEGNIGLIKAVEAFDETMGNKLISFGVFYIRQEILNALSDKSRLVRLPQNEFKKRTVSTSISMNTTISNGNDEGEKTLLDTFASDSKANGYDYKQTIEYQVKSLLANLSDREKEIVCKLFGIGCQEQSEYTLSKKYGICEERIRQIKWEAIKKMKACRG